MNWQEPSDKDRVALGVIRLKAKTGNNTLPPVFINPGVCAQHLKTGIRVTRDTNSRRDLEDPESPL